MGSAVVKGILFGLVVGGVMRLPGKETLVDAFAADLSVMAALWLGAIMANGASRSVLVAESGVAIVSFACAAAAFQGVSGFLTIGFLVQAIWGVLHMRGLGVETLPWVPPFLVAVNITFLLVYFALVGLT